MEALFGSQIIEVEICVRSSKDEDWKQPALLSAPWGPPSDRASIYGGDGGGLWWHHGNEQGYLWRPGLSALSLSSLASREQPHCHFGSQARQSGKKADMRSLLQWKSFTHSNVIQVRLTLFWAKHIKNIQVHTVILRW